MCSSASFVVPLFLSRNISCDRIRHGYAAVLSSILTTSLAVHGGMKRLLMLDKALIYIWMLFNGYVLLHVKNRVRPLSWAFLVGVLGWTKWYEKHRLLHVLMHVSGAAGTTVLIHELLDSLSNEGLGRSRHQDREAKVCLLGTGARGQASTSEVERLERMKRYVSIEKQQL